MSRVVVDHCNHILEMLRDVAKERQLGVWAKPDDLAYRADWEHAQVSLFNRYEDGKPKQELAHFQLQQMPGCCAIMTMSYVGTRKSKLSFEQAVEIVEEASRRAAFGSLVLTQVIMSGHVVKDHEWAPLLANRGFLMSEPFINAKSGNRVVYLTKDLGQVAKMDGFEDMVRV